MNEDKRTDGKSTKSGRNTVGDALRALGVDSDLNKRLQEQLKPFTLAAQRLKPYLDGLNEIARRMQPVFFDLRELEKQYRPHILAIAEALRRFEEFNAGLIERHQKETLVLPPCFGELTMPEVYELFKDREKPAIEVYRDYFAKRENIDALLASWSLDRFYEDRIPILRDACDAHLDGKHTLAIPTFLAQIEGILCDIFGVLDHGKVKGKLSQVRPKIKNEDKLFANAEFIARIITEQVFNSSEDGNRTAEFPNRHRILHGSNPFYYRDKNASLRCILLLDLLRSEKFLALRGKGFGEKES